MSKYRNADPTTEPTFQRNDRVGKGWRKRYAKENDGVFVNTGEGWDWKSKSVSVSKPVVAVSKLIVVDDGEEE